MLQVYEEYWKYTAAKTDILSSNFDETLEVVLDAIDKNEAYNKGTQEYEILQKKISYKNNISLASTRKYINQFVKMGLVKTGLKKYHRDARNFILAKGSIKEVIIANIFLDQNQLNSSVTNDDSASANRVKFLINTLENKRSLDKEDLFALMRSNPNKYPNGFLTNEEIQKIKKDESFENFKKRKYNQVSHLKNVLNILKNYIFEHNGVFYLSEDFSYEHKKFYSKKKEKRSQIHQAAYRDALITESIVHTNENIKDWKGLCMSSGLDISRNKLVASHIWPFSKCIKKAEYDHNNGLLLGENRDYFFDKGLISYDDDGKVIFKASGVSSRWKTYLKNDMINSKYLNNERKKYLKIHRMLFSFETYNEDYFKSLENEIN